eukprot:2443441-Pyramimonas_sp.AAC.1
MGERSDDDDDDDDGDDDDDDDDGDDADDDDDDDIGNRAGDACCQSAIACTRQFELGCDVISRAWAALRNRFLAPIVPGSVCVAPWRGGRMGGSMQGPDTIPPTYVHMLLLPAPPIPVPAP